MVREDIKTVVFFFVSVTTIVLLVQGWMTVMAQREDIAYYRCAISKIKAHESPWACGHPR